MPEKFLPIGIQDFQKMRSGNFVYVDKTAYIFRIIQPTQAFYFLSRPRRFGKSLLVSTLRYLFEGRKDLFDDLWISKHTNWAWEKHPVLVFDFNGISHDDAKILKQGLLEVISATASEHGLSVSGNRLPESFKDLIVDISKKYKKSVVILVDEYDKPLISHLGKGQKEIETAKQNRDILKQFFGVLKEQTVSAALRFVFITGVSKFSRVSIFSDLNNLNDISMVSEYGTFLGYTDEELQKYLDSFIHKMAAALNVSTSQCQQYLRLWYNGYQFTDQKEKVYNPFSILNALEKKSLKNYWFETGTPSFLVNLIQENNYPIPSLENLDLPEEAFTVYDLELLQLEPLLFQTGYITIIDHNEVMYRLGYPNQEVKKSFLSYLYLRFSLVKDTQLKNTYKWLTNYLEKGEMESFISTINNILSAIPYNLIANQAESYYHTLVYLMLSASGIPVQTEVLTSRGRIDMVLEFRDKVYIIEFKCNQTAELAIKQIMDKKYADRYVGTHKKLYLLGINFDTNKRAITDWIVNDIS